MRSVPVKDDLSEHFEPSGLPAMSPDGAPQLVPVREMPVDPPRLCNAGPCRRYHRFQNQLDAQDPMDEHKPDGTVVHHGRVFHVQTHHYCYPTVGIELELGALPVLSCNHWVPVTGLLRTKRGIKRRFERELATWQEEQGSPREVDEATVTGVPAKPMELKVCVYPVPKVRLQSDGDRDVGVGRVIMPLEVEADWTIMTVARAALRQLELNISPDRFTVEIVASFDPADLEPPGFRDPIGNLHATVEQLELTNGERLLVTIITTKEIP